VSEILDVDPIKVLSKAMPSSVPRPYVHGYVAKHNGAELWLIDHSYRSDWNGKKRWEVHFVVKEDKPRREHVTLYGPCFIRGDNVEDLVTAAVNDAIAWTIAEVDKATATRDMFKSFFV